MTYAIQRTIVWCVVFLLVSLKPVEAQWTGRGGALGDYRVQGGDQNLDEKIEPWTVPLLASDSETISDGQMVFVTEVDFAVNGEDAHRISAHALSDGRKIWETVHPERSFVSQDIGSAYPVRPLATPVLSGDFLVCVGYGGSVRCLDKRTGATRWSHDLVEEFQAEPIQCGAATSPWSDGEQVLVACGGPTALVISFELKTGEVRWQAGSGSASYCSFVVFQIENGDRQIVYAAGNELLSLDPRDGRICWSYAYPNPGLTNAVTPIPVAVGKLLIGGQGVQGTRLLEIKRDTLGQYQPETVWKSSRQQPFYCNWVQLQSHPNRVVGFAGKTLYVLDWTTGEILSQSRGWNDCNITAGVDRFWAIRGDGYLGEFVLENDKPTLKRGEWIQRDRVWSAAVVIGDHALVRGRTSLRHFDLKTLPVSQASPPGTDVTAMDAMYGNQPEIIASLLEKAKAKPSSIQWEDYEKVVQDRSIEMGEGAYGKLLGALASIEKWELMERISKRWLELQPNSIPAWQWWVRSLRKLGKVDEAIGLEKSRLVEIEFVVKGPVSNLNQERLVVRGNCESLGDWNGEGGLLLEKGDDGRWRGKAMVPKGDLQFKITRGSWDFVETRADGRSISNRRIRIGKAQQIEVEVAAFQEGKAP